MFWKLFRILTSVVLVIGFFAVWLVGSNPQTNPSPAQPSMQSRPPVQQTPGKNFNF